MSAIAHEFDRSSIDVLSAEGYEPTHEHPVEHLVRPLAGLEERPVAQGYVLRPVGRSTADLSARVDVHRAAFAPSRVTVESYGRLMRTDPYRPELDWVAVAPDGSFAAFCLVWLDRASRIAEMEPVGTHPEHRRRGLARAVCLAALRAARGLAADTGLVYANAGSPAVDLYTGLGFRTLGRHLQFRKQREANPVGERYNPVRRGNHAAEPHEEKGRPMATAVNETSFQDEVLSSDKPVIVDFWAEWCGPCHAVAPVLDKIAEERSDELKLVKVNIDEEQGLAQRYGVSSIPTMILFKNGEPSASAIGAQPKGALEKQLGLAAA